MILFLYRKNLVFFLQHWTWWSNNWRWGLQLELVEVFNSLVFNNSDPFLIIFQRRLNKGRRGYLKYEGKECLSLTRPQVASLSSPCSDFISSLGATTAGNIWVLSYKRPSSLLFSWELKDGQSCAERVFIWMHIMLCSQYSGTFSTYLRIASGAFSSTESLISAGFMCFILPPCQLGPHAWWAGWCCRGSTIHSHRLVHSVSSAPTAVQGLFSQ